MRDLLRLPLACLVLAAASGAQVEVESQVWGFDGKVVLNRFNPLTLHVANHGPKAFDGALTLVCGSGLLRVGARHVVPCYLGPGASRRVQFFPFVAGSDDGWTLSIGNRSVTLTPIVIGLPATVALGEGTPAQRTHAGVPIFGETDFPRSVTGTDGLGCVLLDHQPAFDAAQRRAFLDWLRGGGELHLFHRLHEQPVFDGELALLGDPRDSFAVGAGWVQRHPERIAESAVPARLLPRKAPEDHWASQGHFEALLQRLRDLVRPEHDWALIYFVLVVFFVLAVPVHAWLSLQKLGYLGSIGVLLGVVAAATWLLYEIGRRGYGETQIVHSVSYAKVLGPGEYDVTQLKNVFVTRGARYRIAHAAAGSIYSTAQRSEQVPAVVTGGSEAAMVADIPVFTSRPFVHRAVFTAPPVDLEVVSWPDERRAAVEIQWRGPGRVYAAIAFRERYGMNLDVGADGRLRGRSWQPASQVLRLDRLEEVRYRSTMYRFGMDRAVANLPDLAKELMVPLAAERLGLLLEPQANTAVTRDDELRLVLLCDGPPELAILQEGAPLGEENGMVVYEMLLRRDG